MIARRRAPVLSAGTAMLLLLGGCAGTAATEAVDAPSPSASATVATTPPTVAASPEPPTPEAVAAPCQDSVTVRLDREIGSGREGYLVLTNSGSEPCSLVGFVEAAAVDAAGTDATTVDHSDLDGLAGVAVELAPGASAYSWIFWDDTSDTLDACDERVDAVALDVLVPGASAEQRVETGALPLCEGRGSLLHLGPIAAEQRTASKGY